jgi:hypothetical protein
VLKRYLWETDSSQNHGSVDHNRSKVIVRIEMKCGATETPSIHGTNCGSVKCVQCAIDLEGLSSKFSGLLFFFIQDLEQTERA